MKFARIVFYIAAVYGLLSVPPLYFMFDLIGRRDPPPITHPQFYYGFVGVALAWQIAFLIIGSNPVRFRVLMIPSVIEKLSYVSAVAALHAQERVTNQQAFSALPDLLFLVLFVFAFVKTPKPG